MRIVYSYYVLDIVHRGHLNHMKNSKVVAGKDGISVVGILTKEAVLEKKDKKPILSFNERINLESEFVAGGKAKVRFYTIPVKGSSRPLKIDFVQDVIFDNPTIRKIEGVRVYSIENIYLQKIIAISGTQPETDEIGRQIIEGRKEARDVFDIYILSKNIQPLHIFLQRASSQLQRGIIHWYRTFSRQELKLALIDLDIYDTKFNSREMIIYLENEIKQFTREVIGG